MEEKLEKSPLKPEIDDAMLSGAFEGAYLTERYQNITRIDGHGNLNYSIGRQSSDLAEEKNGDGVVANGIATAILDSIVIYGKTGEQFLKEKLEEQGESFSQEEYLIDIAKSITNLYQYDRKKRIIDGVVDVINDNSDNIEANAAKTAIMQNEYWCEDRFPEADVLRERFLQGNIIKTDKMYRRLECMHHKSISEEMAIKNLEIAYMYLKKNYDELSQTFKKEFEGKSDSKILAYYIANLHDSEMEKVLKFAKEEQMKEER